MSRLDEVALLLRRSKDFMSTAKYLLERGTYDLAAFNVEQSVQLYLKGVMLEKLGDFPRTHSVRLLLEMLSRALNDELRKFMGSRSVELGALEDAYLVSRYIYREYSKDESEQLLIFAEELIKFVDKLRPPTP